MTILFIGHRADHSGMTYGGMYGVNMAAVLQAVPRHARGTVAGFTQQGFGAGNLIASGLHFGMSEALPCFVFCAWLTFFQHAGQYGWRPLYYLGAGLMVTAVALRIITPDYSLVGPHGNDASPDDVAHEQSSPSGKLPFWVKFRFAITRHWPIFIYCTVLTGCFNTLGHGHLDVYPSFLEIQRGLSSRHETYVTVILQCGGVLGGIVGGYMSRYSTKWVPFGFAISLAPMLPAIILPTRWNNLAAAAFFFEFSYGAAIGNIGNILQMVCPHPGIRAAFGGVCYNLGNAISSIAPTIETKMGDSLRTKQDTPNYGHIILILAGIVSSTLLSMSVSRSANQSY